MSQQKIYPIGRVYSIRSPNTDEIYIGSTFNPLYKRFSGHKGSYKHYLKGGNVGKIASFKILEAGESYIELIEQYENITKNELLKYEGEYIRSNKESINRNIAGRTDKEWRKEWRYKNDDKIKKYYEDNKEQLGEFQKKYYEDNKEQIKKQVKQYRDNNKDKIKNYLANNKDKINETKKEYYNKNKDKLKLARLEKKNKICV